MSGKSQGRAFSHLSCSFPLLHGFQHSKNQKPCVRTPRNTLNDDDDDTDALLQFDNYKKKLLSIATHFGLCDPYKTVYFPRNICTPVKKYILNYSLVHAMESDFFFFQKLISHETNIMCHFYFKMEKEYHNFFLKN